MASFDSDPREFALELVENQIVAADHLLLYCLKYMSSDEVRDMLDCNELSPRFDNDEDEEVCIDCGKSNTFEGTCIDCEREQWLEQFDEDEYDVESMRIDIANNNLEVGDDQHAEQYKHENIVLESIVNGNRTQAKEQCQRFGLDYDQMLRQCEQEDDDRYSPHPLNNDLDER